jgi:hypothetical protein
MGTLYKIGDSFKQPDQLLTYQNVRKINISNMVQSLDNIFGTDHPPYGLAGHDHSKAGGTNTYRSICSVAFGPSNSGPGIALAPPIPGQSFTTNTKLVASFIARIPGGLATLNARVAVFLGTFVGAKTVTLAISVRPLSNSGYGYSDNAHRTQTFTAFTTASNSAYVDQEISFTLTDFPYVNEALDNSLEFCIWLVSDPPKTVGNDYRLLSCELYNVSDYLPDIEPYRYLSPMPKNVFSFNEAYTNRIVDMPLTSLEKGLQNELLYSLLGMTYGLDSDLAYPNKRQAWLERARAHQHKGRYVPREDGSYYHDAALIARSYAISSLCNDVALSGGTMSINPVKGDTLHPSGALDAQWKVFTQVVSIPAGCRILRLEAAIMPVTSKVLAYCNFYVKITPSGESQNSSNSLVLQLNQGETTESQTKSGSYTICRIEPINGIGWQSNESRKSQGLGLWTNDALKAGNQAPQGFNTTNAYRISKPIDILIGNPAYNSSEAMHNTAKYMVSIRFALYSADMGSAYALDTNANLMSWHCYPLEGQ